MAYLRYQNLLTVGTTNAYYSGRATAGIPPLNGKRIP